MKSEDLLRAIGDIDEQYISEADPDSCGNASPRADGSEKIQPVPVKGAKRRIPWQTWVVGAAAIMLVLGISGGVLRRTGEHAEGTVAGSGYTSSSQREKEMGEAAAVLENDMEMEEAAAAPENEEEMETAAANLENDPKNAAFDFSAQGIPNEDSGLTAGAAEETDEENYLTVGAAEEADETAGYEENMPEVEEAAEADMAETGEAAEEDMTKIEEVAEEDAGVAEASPPETKDAGFRAIYLLPAAALIAAAALLLIRLLKKR